MPIDFHCNGKNKSYYNLTRMSIIIILYLALSYHTFKMLLRLVPNRFHLTVYSSDKLSSYNWFVAWWPRGLVTYWQW